MTSQLPLPFDPRRLARAENPQTSKSAASACSELRSEHHNTILRVMRDTGYLYDDWTADEIAAQCGLDRHQVGRRLHELERAVPKLVKKSGRQRATPTGRMACCYGICSNNQEVQKED